MVQNKDSWDMDPKQEQLIYAMLQYPTKEEAARKAGVGHNTMYRWLRDPAFKAAFRAARREVFDDALAILEKNAKKAAQALVNELDPSTATGSATVLAAATRILALAFKAQETIAVQEELAALATVVDSLNAGQASEPAAPNAVAETVAEWSRKALATEQEQAEACRLRFLWMSAIGHCTADIADSLRYNRPQTAVEEQGLLDVVRKHLEWEEKYRGDCPGPVGNLP